MEIRGRRECKACGQRWTYYEAGSVACPNCGSLRSVGVGDRQRHTDAPVELDLSPYLAAVEAFDVAEVADDVQSACREYARKRGFIHAGDLQPPDDRLLLARELVQALDVYERLRDPGDAEQRYLLSLLRGATNQGEAADAAATRPDPAAVPPSMHAARGLAYAETLQAFRREATTWLDDNPDSEGRRALGQLGERLKRVQALQGEVPPDGVERLVRAAREITRYLEADDEAALSRARDRLRRSVDAE